MAEADKTVNRTGAIWGKPSRTRARLVQNVCRKLDRDYGESRLGNPKDPVDDLVYVVISNRTGPTTAERTFRRLKAAYPTWDRVLDSSIEKLRSELEPAGLSRVKSRQLCMALKKIKGDFGACNLRRLKGRCEETVHDYLTSLPGVSDKVAKCIMMFTMDAQVLPVDVHVHRIASRLGWTTRKRADQCHSELESLVPSKWRFGFHVGCILHGRRICRANEPLCDDCSLKTACEYYATSRSHV
jgi:endonuclease III